VAAILIVFGLALQLAPTASSGAATSQAGAYDEAAAHPAALQVSGLAYDEAAAHPGAFQVSGSGYDETAHPAARSTGTVSTGTHFVAPMNEKARMISEQRLVPGDHFAAPINEWARLLSGQQATGSAARDATGHPVDVFRGR